MAHMARGYGNTVTQWQVTGYHPAEDPMIGVSRLDRKIERSKKIGVLLTNWFSNAIVASGTILACAAVIAIVTILADYIGDFVGVW